MPRPAPSSSRRIPLTLLAFSLAGSLAGCASPPWAPPTPHVETPPPEVKPKPPKAKAAKPAGTTAAKPDGTASNGAPPNGAPPNGAAGGGSMANGVGQPSPTQPPTTPSTTVAALPPTPERLVGRDEAGIRALFGTPAGLTERPPARIWTYEGTGCRLELSFYMDVASRAFRVLTYDITPRGAAPTEGQRCLAALGSTKG